MKQEYRNKNTPYAIADDAAGDPSMVLVELQGPGRLNVPDSRSVEERARAHAQQGFARARASARDE